MGERKAVNKYYPPDWDPSKGGLNKYHGQHALRERAHKLHLGIMVIRFEMPFNMWCGGCKAHIGMGVRYNAEKKKIGMYYTTPLWQFRMKCHLCDNYIEIHTDPKNFDYLVVSGGARKEERYDQEDAECAAAHEPEERKKLNTDPMFQLEYKEKDEKVIESAAPLMDTLQQDKDVWKDDYTLNQSLRKRFREDTKDDRKHNKILKDKMGVSLKMLPTTKADKYASSLVRFNKTADKLKIKASLGSIFSNTSSTKGKTVSLLHNLRKAGVRRRSDEGRKDECQNIVKRRRMSSGSTSSSVSLPISDSTPELATSSKQLQDEGEGSSNFGLSEGGVEELNVSKNSLGLISNYSSSGDSS